MIDFYKVGGVGIMGFISPMNTDDTYAVIDPLYGIDGFRNVETVGDMLAIPEERRRAGMIVGVGGGQHYYKLKDVFWNDDLTDWEEVYFQTSLSQGIIYIDKENPIGLVDGDNDTFEILYEPIINSEHVYLNGLLQDINEDYFLEGKLIMFVEPPVNNSRIRCTYRTL
jgi:hypothetical protein